MSIFWIMATGLAANAVDVSAVTTVEYGVASPSFTVTSSVDGAVTVELSCSGKTFGLQRQVAPGAVVELELSGLAAGSHDCTGTLELQQEGGVSSMPLSLHLQLLEPLGFQVLSNDYDAEAKRLLLHPTRPLAEAWVEVVGEQGVITRERVDVSSSPPSVSWVEEGEVINLAVTATDKTGLRASLDLSPWSYNIPHKDVVFPSGSSTLPGEERHKLQAAMEEILAVSEKYGSIVDVKLYVAGYTDTVGDAAANERLSKERAASIAYWFRTAGFKYPIHVAGFGERVLAVATPDETDEAANRRALYIIAAQAPEGAPFPNPAWTPL